MTRAGRDETTRHLHGAVSPMIWPFRRGSCWFPTRDPLPQPPGIATVAPSVAGYGQEPSSDIVRETPVVPPKSPPASLPFPTGSVSVRFVGGVGWGADSRRSPSRSVR